MVRASPKPSAPRPTAGAASSRTAEPVARTSGDLPAASAHARPGPPAGRASARRPRRIARRTAGRSGCGTSHRRRRAQPAGDRHAARQEGRADRSRSAPSARPDEVPCRGPRGCKSCASGPCIAPHARPPHPHVRCPRQGRVGPYQHRQDASGDHPPAGASSGIIGFPLRLLARENYDRMVAAKGEQHVALITGEEKIVPPEAQVVRLHGGGHAARPPASNSSRWTRSSSAPTRIAAMSSPTGC